MPYVANTPGSYENQIVGEGQYKGQCAVFVQVAGGVPSTFLWKQGSLVKGMFNLAKGTAIATFGTDGNYTNKADGTAHAAIYIRQDAIGIEVWDQWLGQPVHKRWIRFQNGASGVTHRNDGNFYHVIE